MEIIVAIKIMKDFVSKYEVWIFLVLLVLGNALFVTGIVSGILPEQLYHLGRFALLGAILFSLIFLVRGVDGVLHVVRPLLEWRRSPLVYIFAFVWTIALCLLVLVTKGFITGDHLSYGVLAPGLAKITDPALVRTIVASSLIGEIVWISYAVRELSKQFTHYVSALIVGMVWTMWWLPMAIHNYGIIPNLPLLALMFNQMGIAAMCAFVYFHTRSALIVLIMQFVFNATILVFPVTPDEGGVVTYWAFALTYFSAATLLFLRFGPGPLFQKKKSNNETRNWVGSHPA